MTLTHPLADLREKALKTLQGNLVPTQAGTFFAAGGGQFRTLWLRDFCFSVPGLIAAGYEDVVSRQIRLYLDSIHPDGALPRGMDVIDPKARVVCQSILKGWPQKLLSGLFDYQRNSLRAEYLGEHGTPAFDSGLLILRACRDFEGLTGTESPLREADLVQIGEFYERARSTNASTNESTLLSQPGFSDWQDSARREGRLLHTQLLQLQVSLWLEKKSLIQAAGFPTSARLSSEIQKAFTALPSGLRRETSEGQQVALDSQALIVRENLLGEGTPTWTSLQSSDLWKTPGRPIAPAYAVSEISWTTQGVGLRSYHDGLDWGWVVAEAASTSYSQGNHQLGDQLLTSLAAWEPSELLSEVYSNGKPFRTWLYRSENPFTWTAAKVCEAIAARPNNA